jgi:dipeptidyl aminopeptidase/acylaminoacyl peptidase
VDLANDDRVRQLTDGDTYEHSLDWSPRGEEILLISNREPDADRVFNNDIFVLNGRTGALRRLTNTRSAEYDPAWSPDGVSLAFLATHRDLTSSETTMEDTHVSVMNGDGRARRELTPTIDNRHGAPQWSSDGSKVVFSVQQQGNSCVYAQALDGTAAQPMTTCRGTVGGWSALPEGLAFSWTTTREPAELFYVRWDLRTRDAVAPGRPVRLTNLNDELLAGRAIVEPLTLSFKSFDGRAIEAFVTEPVGLDPSGKYPLVVMIHGGPHGQQGPSFNPKAQIYAGAGFASLMVNYRGSTGYGQTFADAISGDQNGGEAKDVLGGVSAALARYPWLDRNALFVEGTSYGGQLTNWLVTQTDRFKAAASLAGISNLVSFNYMAYYHDYLAVEFGAYPHERGIIDRLWERSPIRYAKDVKTPVLLLHGENDNDVPIAEAEQFYIALKDVGVETVMVRYPREGHGLRETQHVADAIDRTIAWYRKHRPARSGLTPDP